MNGNVIAAIEKIEVAIERANQQKLYSKQGRFKNPTDMFASMYNWNRSSTMEADLYPYVSDSRKRDGWLAQLWKKEPHISGVINQVISIDKNRGWTLTGPKRQVNIYNQILRDSEDGLGWREFMSMVAQDYYTSDLGSVVEMGREGKRGPLRALYHTDPTLCRLTGNRDFPLYYYSAVRAEGQQWESNDFFNVHSMPSSQENYNRLGFCALSRAVNLVNLLMAVYQYDQEQLGARAPKGLLLMQNISQTQWDEAMATRDVKLDQQEMQYFGGVAVLCQEGLDQMDAKLIALSQLPDGFDRKTVTDQIMFGFALIFGYSADEFWPVQFGALGRSRETEIHHLRAANKGGSDFVFGFQDRLQREMPSTMLFEFNQRDFQAQSAEADVYAVWSGVAKTFYEQGMGVLDRNQALRLLVSKGIIPPEFTEEVETDTVAGADGTVRGANLRVMRDRYTDTDQVRSAAELYPQEPIVVYNWPSGHSIRLWDKGEDVFARHLWQGADLIERGEL